mgnify:FL=1|tara:strand:- start:2463 stop:3068 length:606 start_codon:yes stop_codon:yes gene_type:complete
MNHLTNPANARPPSYSTFSYTIPAGETVQLYREADFVTCLSATDKFKLSFDNGSPSGFEQGLTYRTRDGFRNIDLINESAAEISVTIGVGRGDVRDARVSIGGTIGADVVAPENFDAGAPVSALNGANTRIAFSDANRREILLVNGGTGTVYITGWEFQTAGNGLPLVGGQSLSLTTSAAVYARNDSGAAVPIYAGKMGVS